jgi:Secretion system C-terminal sorting domain
MLLPLLSTAQYLGGYFTSINSGANNYSIDLTTYTDSISLDDHCHAVIEIWNATGTVMISQDTLDRSNGGPGNCDSLVGAGEYLSQGVMRNRYHLDYQFPGQGNYLLRFTGQNLSSGILNIGAQQAMVVEYELYVNPFGANDHSATIVNDAVMAACLGTTFGFDPLWMDAEGDSLAFSLGVPDGVAMYASPSTLADTLTVDSHSGQLHLVDPQVVGWLLFLVECKAYRNGLLQGRTRYTQSILVMDSCATTTVDARSSEAAYRIYPNPTTTAFTLQLPPHITYAHIQIRDLQGRAVATLQAYTGTPVDVSALAHGLYFVTVVCRGGSQVLKIVKE